MSRVAGRAVIRAPVLIARGIAAAVRGRMRLVLGVAVGVVALDVLLPPVVLAVARKPWTYFTFNPWLRRLPEYLASDAPLAEKVDFLGRVALFWFTADGPYGEPEWGFAVDTVDVVRFVAMGSLVAGYFALWLHHRQLGTVAGLRDRAGRASGVAGALVSVLGLSTGPCSVVGCGAPVLPVVGLAFAGLSSGTLALLSALSKVAVSAVLAVLAAGVLFLAWHVGSRLPPRTPAGP